MKSEITKAPDVVVPQYPYFGMWPDGTMIVLFTAPNTGTVVHEADDPSRIGEYYKLWAEPDFKRWNGSVTITA